MGREHDKGTNVVRIRSDTTDKRMPMFSWACREDGERVEFVQ